LKELKSHQEKNNELMVKSRSSINWPK
jgi:hypothetical protein